MDVKRGHCWRCEKSTDDSSDVCSLCKMATYCSVKCRQEDLYRHKPECEVWGLKKCNNPKCSESGKLKECTGCNEAWYCGLSCQQKDWQSHKNICCELTKAVKTSANHLRVYFQGRSNVPLGLPYYIGNALAIDMLNLQENECSKSLNNEERESAVKEDYSVLTAGCGNLRNVIHTVASLPQEFLGKVHVTLNDFDPFVQARNVLFLYMMAVFATRSDIATIVTTLWYSVHLSSKDYKFLQNCLKNLIDLSGSALKCSTQGLIQISDEYMPQLREVWQVWLELQCQRNHPKSIDLRQQRQEMFASDPVAFEGIPLFKGRIPKEYLQSFEEWLQSGVFVPSDNFQSLEYDNPTMTGYNLENQVCVISEVPQLMKSPKQHTFVYCVGAALFPFGEWDQLLVQKQTSNKSLVVLYHAYITNQVQQTVALLNNKRLVTTIHVCNCLDLSSRLPPEVKFERIFTSNIADYIGTKNLLRAFKDFLKTANKNARIVTQYWNWYVLFPNAYWDEDSKRDCGGTQNTCVVAAINDTSQQNFEYNPKDLNSVMQLNTTIDQNGKFFFQEYYNYMVYFISYMRSELMACDESLSVTKAVSFKLVLNTEGFQMVDFRRELNGVVPFAYRRNIRPISLLRGMERMVEWRLPE